jgi:predicted small metal-binding protein
MKELKCTDKFCEWKAIADTEDEVLKAAAQHGQQEHGSSDLFEDIQAGLRPKIRDVKSERIRGEKSA